MPQRMSKLKLIVGLIVVMPIACVAADPVESMFDIAAAYRVVPNVTYLVADGYESKLDVIAPRDTSKPLPTLLYIHGGGWVGGDKDAVTMHFLPYLAMGFAVVNVEYRLARVAIAPAAVEDGRCALRWVIENAAEYGLDATRIVVSGHSAGGHLSLTTAMLSSSAGLDRRCPARSRSSKGAPAGALQPEMPVAAVVNWFGITDVADLVEGPNAKRYAIAWMGGQANWHDVAKRVSPVEYVRKGLPPILTIHGDADPTVPYEHAVRLHKGLENKGVVNQLHTIAGGKHGGFSRDQSKVALGVIQAFLSDNGIL